MIHVEKIEELQEAVTRISECPAVGFRILVLGNQRAYNGRCRKCQQEDYC